MEQALTVREVALLLQVDEKTVYRLTRKGDLPGFKVAGAWRFQRSDMTDWVNRQKDAAQAAISSDSPSTQKERH